MIGKLRCWFRGHHQFQMIPVYNPYYGRTYRVVCSSCNKRGVQ